MSWVKLTLFSIGLFGGVSYLSFKYHYISSFQEEFDKNTQKRKLLFNIHQQLALKYDDIMDNYEKFSKIPQYRKILCSYTNGEVLETGVGTSRNLQYYPSGIKLTAIDWSPNILECALQKSVCHIDYQYKLDDVEQLSFKDNSFDCVIDTFGLEYYLQPEKAIKEMKRVCKKDGNILILTSGRSHYDLLNLFLEYKTGYIATTQGYFPNRKWDDYFTEQDFQFKFRERKMNGSVYIYVLQNLKEQ